MGLGFESVVLPRPTAPLIPRQGTFAFIDLPGGVRIAAVNVTLFDGGVLPLQLVLGAPKPEALLQVRDRVLIAGCAVQAPRLSFATPPTSPGLALARRL